MLHCGIQVTRWVRPDGEALALAMAVVPLTSVGLNVQLDPVVATLPLLRCRSAATSKSVATGTPFVQGRSNVLYNM